MDLSAPDQSKGGSSTASLEEMGSEEDLFSTYIDLDKLGGCNCSDQSGGGNKGPNGGPDDGSGEPNVNDGGGEGEEKRSSRHRHSCSVDGSSTSTGVFGEVMEAKKAMPPDKLAELWNLDPKRAKRCAKFYLFCWVPGLLHFPVSGCRENAGRENESYLDFGSKEITNV